jgi:hypothetical protein
VRRFYEREGFVLVKRSETAWEVDFLRLSLH